MSGRDGKGQFAKGNGGGPGRPKKNREDRYYEIAMTACPFADWRAIWKTAVEQVKSGDSTARKFVADYLIGPPIQQQRISGEGEDGAVLVSFVDSNVTSDDV